MTAVNLKTSVELKLPAPIIGVSVVITPVGVASVWVVYGSVVEVGTESRTGMSVVGGDIVGCCCCGGGVGVG